MNWLWWGGLVNELLATPLECLECGCAFYIESIVEENMVATNQELLPICPKCGAVDEVRYL